MFDLVWYVVGFFIIRDFWFSYVTHGGEQSLDENEDGQDDWMV